MKTASDNLVLDGWFRVPFGPARAGDKYWDEKRGVWMPVTVNQRRNVEDYPAVIRKG